ncbi:ornithine carbamoyltransferase [Bartonella bacilliformis str. Heidi Mejia]|uniref:Ornithine carbamoyltransferase n=2 Tax=Bartonella bacilliformis TaxID=774 RepID=A1UU87_BARBK|nr:ornithine carbamoyltransferase [Bartonella bacilliformis]ABM44913.1 ornithine carbamoyltransferase [Bartonella bacilliformis KC583]AMG86261.1 ornithine carbamoyltransferase [Bartonella bacilliformis]EKS43172.1 ornithine carbamoyltransferase [Bartonella bacilliformis INS]EYS88940.1 ornithine carbamoyltransferase [Bartonella bacilliformis San Pedro600-02]EYS90901.1 ornithine carbamoyltransferase [Bartonella bacilliformis str. Heidi Mejia]
MTHALRHFTDLSILTPQTARTLIDYAKTLKKTFKEGKASKPFVGKTLAMIFEKPSTRTRVSFDIGMRQLGGDTLMLTGSEMQLGHSETIADTARVLSRFVDIILLRTAAHHRMLELAQYAQVPVINALTDDTHPCQILADILTYEEHRGPIASKIFAWVGDGNNVLHSLIEATALFDFHLRFATPQGSEPQARYINWARERGAHITCTHNPQETVENADCIITDTWISMGQEFRARNHSIFQPYQVNEALIKLAKPDALFMHCLPAHRGEEVVDSVIDGPHSVVFDEAENRLHIQKAILSWCLQDAFFST